MPNRIIKESIWTSPNLNALSLMAELHFYRLLPLPDDHGCFELTPLVVKGRIYPLRPEITTKNIKEWNHELVVNNIIKMWEYDQRTYGLFISWSKHQRIRSLHARKTPEPPLYLLNGIGEKTEKVNSLELLHVDNCRQLTSSDGPNPNPNPNPNLNLNLKKTSARKNDFDDFWKIYPKKKSKGQAKKTWDSLSKQKKLPELSILLNAIAAQKAGHDWQKDSGKYIPYPSTWLNAEGWEDEINNNPITNDNLRPQTYAQAKDAEQRGLAKLYFQLNAQAKKKEDADHENNNTGSDAKRITKT